MGKKKESKKRFQKDKETGNKQREINCSKKFSRFFFFPLFCTCLLTMPSSFSIALLSHLFCLGAGHSEEVGPQRIMPCGAHRQQSVQIVTEESECV